MLNFFKGALLLFVATTLTQCKKDEEKTPTQTTDNTTNVFKLFGGTWR